MPEAGPRRAQLPAGACPHAHAVPAALCNDAAALLKPPSVRVAAAREAGITVRCLSPAGGRSAGMRDTGAAGTFVLVGLGATDMSLPVTDIMNRELTVTGIYRYAGTWPATLHLAVSGKVDLDALVTRHVGLDELPPALGEYGAPGELKSIVVPA